MKIKRFSPTKSILLLYIYPRKGKLGKVSLFKIPKNCAVNQKSHTVREFNSQRNKALSVVVKPSLFVTFKSTPSTPLSYFKG